MKAYITKYALTEGILQMEVEQDERFPNMVCYRENYTRYIHGEGHNWHRTIESARDRAEVMRAKKIASIKKQIAKLESLKF